MWFRVSGAQLCARSILCGFILAAAGCQSGDSASVLGLGGTKDKPAQPKVLQSDLLAYCPKVTLREGTAIINSYAKGGDGDPAKLIYQASMSDATRSCTRSGGTLTMNVAVAGKVVPGPAAPPGEVTLPIRIVATQGDNVLYTKLTQHTVALGDASAAVQFVFNDPQVAIPEPTEADVLLFAGFDQGPPGKGDGKKK
jgi:hypothetical protein